MENKHQIIDPTIFAAMYATVNGMVEHTKAVIITTNNVKQLADIRAKNNKYIKAVDDQIKAAKEALIDEVFGEQLKEIEGIVAPLRAANKEFSALLLETDKQRYKENAQEIFDQLNDGGASGELYDWDEFYDPKWYNLKKIELLGAIMRKLKVLRSKEDMTDRTYFITATAEQFENIDKWLTTHQYIYERDE